MALLVSMVLSGIKRNILSQFMMKNLINSYRIFVTRTILQNTNRAYSRDDLIEKFGAMKQISNIEQLIHTFVISVINYAKGFPIEDYLETVYKVGYKWKMNNYYGQWEIVYH